MRAHGREVPGRARRDPAAERRVLERLREVAQRQAVLGQLALQHRAGRAGLDPRGARDRVDLEHTIERAQVERDRARITGRHVGRHTADDRCAAAVGDRGDALGRAPLEQLLDVALVARARDEVGRMREAAAKAFDDIAVGLAERVRGACV